MLAMIQASTVQEHRFRSGLGFRVYLEALGT